MLAGHKSPPRRAWRAARAEGPRAQALRPGDLLGTRSERHRLAKAGHVARADRRASTLRRLAAAFGCAAPPPRHRLPLPRLPADVAPPDMPRLALVLLVCGTRGDVQPFVAIVRGPAPACRYSLPHGCVCDSAL